MLQRLSLRASLVLLASVACQPHAYAAPQRLKDIAAAEGSGLPAEDGWSTVVGNTLLFAADDGAHGVELWRSDGTSEGTFLLRDITPGSGSSNPGGPADVHRNAPQLGGSALFQARNGVLNGGAVWKSDGSIAGTVLVSSAPGGFGYATRFGDVVLFAGSTSADRDLWKTDGTEAGTTQVAWLIGLRGIIDLEDGQVLLNASQGNGFQLRHSDGKSSSPFLLNETPNVVFGRGQSGLLMRSFAVYVGGGYLWGSGGSSGGTAQLSQTIVGMPEGGEMFVRANGMVFFFGGNRSLWRTEGPSATQPVYSQRALEMVAVGDTLYFVAEPNSDAELWKTDGKPNGTKRVKSGFRSIRQLIAFDGVLYFSGDDGLSGEELWTSDGTEAGTKLVADIAADGDAAPIMLGASAQTLFFSADDGTTGRELWALTPARPDAGMPQPDAGATPEAGVSDASFDDAAGSDAGFDAAASDAGHVADAARDAGVALDADSEDARAQPGDVPDAGLDVDARDPDAGEPQGGETDRDGEGDAPEPIDSTEAGTDAKRRKGDGCSLIAGKNEPSKLLLGMLSSLLLVRRRRARYARS